MAEENIWKKQAQMNRWKAENKPESPRSNLDSSVRANQNNSPINQFLKTTNNSTPSPPWAKNNPPNNNAGPAPWLKNSGNPSGSNNNQPSWVANRSSRDSDASSNYLAEHVKRQNEKMLTTQLGAMGFEKGAVLDLLNEH